MAIDAAQPVPVRVQRAPAVVLFLAGSFVLLLAAYLDPAPQGMGTHCQLGLPPCGMLASTGVPCATCGMTTSFSLAAHGRLIDAFLAQPAGALLALMTAIGVLVCGWSMVTGMSLLPLWRQLWRPRTVLIGAVIVIAAWIYKIMVVTGSY